MRNLEQARQIFKEANCELLEDTFKSGKIKMRYIASCGHEHSITLENFRSGKGRLCRKCRYKSVSKKNKLDYDYVKLCFEKEGCVLLSEKYENAAKQRLRYIATCGHENEMDFNHFMSGGGRMCKKCSGNYEYTYDDVYSKFEELGCELLESDYVNCKTYMRYRALCGHESYIKFDTLLNGNVSLMCDECRTGKQLDESDIIKQFEENGCKVISDVHKSKRIPIKYVASCGHENTISYEKFLLGYGVKCPTCVPYNKIVPKKICTRGELNQRVENGNIYQLRLKVFERDGYKCTLCGSKKSLNAHHIYSWNKYEDKRFDIDNLITLCEECHKTFHKEFGYGNNTKEQFQAFKENHYANTEGLTINQVCNE